jgi:ADP-dependent NAD(P)H-hydrate dehydratase
MPEIHQVTTHTLRAWPLPAPGANKEQRGKVMVVGGTATTPGAVLLAAEAALRAGAGKLTVGTAVSAASQVAVRLPEAQVWGLPEDLAGNIAPAAAEELLEQISHGDTVLIGSGFIDPEASVELLERLVPQLDATVVVDAVASAYVTKSPERLADLRSSFLMSINPKELGKTLQREGGASDDIEADTAELARRTGAVVLCGATEKVVSDAAGRQWRVSVGGPGLGVSGSGDVQAGIVTGLAARGAEHAQAAVWGGYLHGRAGERLAERVGTVGFLAREIPAEVPAILTSLA